MAANKMRAAILSCILATPVFADFALRDGDTVVFLGDSITAARGYGKMIENYTLLRYPERKVRFINAGHGGDTAAGGLKRLQRDVFACGATVLTVAYGINDIGWGLKADAEHRQLYLDSIREIIRQCQQRNVRVFICGAAITAEDPKSAETSFLQKMCDDALEIARSMNAGAIDLQRGMRAVQKRKLAHSAAHPNEKDKPSLHAADTIHLNDTGQLAMGFAILKGLGAPAEVSSAVLDAQTAKLVDAQGCQISEVASHDGKLEFTRLDEGLPLNFGGLGVLNFRFIPIPDELNRYMLSVRNLSVGKYELLANGRLVGTLTNAQLQAGVNISSMMPDPWLPGGPWDAQATLLKPLTEARSELAYNAGLAPEYLAGNFQQSQIQQHWAAVLEQIDTLQRSVARPAPYRFTIRPTGSE